MRRDPREPEREAIGAWVTRQTGRLTTIMLVVATLVLIAAVLMGRN
jgi:hypothetical protein